MGKRNKIFFHSNVLLARELCLDTWGITVLFYVNIFWVNLTRKIKKPEALWTSLHSSE